MQAPQINSEIDSVFLQNGNPRSLVSEPLTFAGRARQRNLPPKWAERSKGMAKILIAEDDKAMRVFLDRALSRSGHEVDAVSSGDTAARCVAKEVFVLLVMDIDMLGLNDVDLARQVLERTPRQAILFVTGFAARAIKATDVLACGARVLSKLFGLSELVSHVEGGLAGGAASPRGTT